MNRRMLLTTIIALFCIVLAGCANGIPAVPEATPASTDQPTPAAAGAGIPTTAPTIAAPAGSAALACSSGSRSASLTPELTEGPYFKADSPERASLVDASTPGTKLVISGYVYSADCQPVAHALLDFWQADANGSYDNTGYNLRGHQYTDANGRYELTSVVPGLYIGRTEHIHVKVQAPNARLITTQLFFPGVAQNDSDGIYDPALLLALQQEGSGDQALYNFVVPTQ
ncbi:MAG TPA: hypothetical protein VMJ64_03755 [Anaerolineales bacterium]|nr:hypothetical protein [Anaerolineales bacterium]